ncbi:MAG: aminodeoxychorismate synthase component I [Candidatus Obscuribacterales bacterium]|nr:aminodeoxychorismate synthase component I [Steroidobacteraceae bacterium]
MALTQVELPPDALLRLHAAHPLRYPVLLQSAALGEPLGRYDILLAHPQAQLKLHAEGSLTGALEGDQGKGFLAALDLWWQRERIAADTDLAAAMPFRGGWFVFLGYELAGEIEPRLRLPRDANRSIAQALRIPIAVVLRHSDCRAWIVAEPEFAALAREIVADISALHLDPLTLPDRLLANRLQEDDSTEYLRNVERTLQHIAAGDIYQANLSRAWRGQLATGVMPHHVYARLRRTNPAPFAALAVLDDRAIISSTPERLIEVRAGVVATRPIAGTRPRSKDRADDTQRLHELHSHPKERAEHVMLIDLERNDLGRICEPGTVRVDEFMTLESYAHVHHIVSNVQGRLRANVTPGQALAAVFPGGTITGCPKVRCMEIIGALERTPRGAYTGSIGYLNRDGSMDFNILIRTFDVYAGAISFRAGAGIVADSVPAKELEETRAKAQGLVHALEPT